MKNISKKRKRNKKRLNKQRREKGDQKLRILEVSGKVMERKEIKGDRKVKEKEIEVKQSREGKVK